jgi:hypothetical protein
MSLTLKDGTGSGNEVKVDSNNRAHTYSVTIAESNQANEDGNAYNINTGDITLTNATETPVFYIKNNEDADLHITAFALHAGSTTGGTTSEDIKWTVVRNPTAGTIISNANDVDINSNRNFGSSNTLLTNSYKGATGETMTDGDNHIVIKSTNQSRVFATIDELIPKGSSIGIKCTPQTSNTSMTIYAAAICHLENGN